MKIIATTSVDVRTLSCCCVASSACFSAVGMKWESPRGEISIDPETRDIVQTVYIRKVEKVDGKVQNVEIDKIDNVKDPAKK